MVVLPAIVPAVTTPPDDIVATGRLDEDHVTALFDAVEGDILAVIVRVVPIFIVIVDGVNVRDDTRTNTVTKHVVENPPLTVVTLIFAELPAVIAVTTPDEDTLTFDGLEDDHDTALFVALAGLTVATNDTV